MRSILFYYSNTGNTQLTVDSIQKSLPSTDLWEWKGGGFPELNNYELIGFAFPTYNLSLPPQVRTRLQALPPLGGKPIFLLQTYGVMPGKAVKEAWDLLKNKGAELVAYHRLSMPESYPPFRKKGITNQNHPTNEEREEFNHFIEELSSWCGPKNGKPLKIKLGFWDWIIPAPKEGKIRKDFGKFHVESQSCSTCGVCADNCPEGAVLLDRSPQFQMDRCAFCYRCFNHCPQKAISTSAVSAEYAYPEPGKDLKEMFL